MLCHHVDQITEPHEVILMLQEMQDVQITPLVDALKEITEKILTG